MSYKGESVEGESLAKLFNLPEDISDEMIKSKYSLIEIARNDPIDDKFNNVKLHDLFIEGGNLYVTTDYQVNSTEAFDAAIKTYYEYVLVHNDVIKGLKNVIDANNLKGLNYSLNPIYEHTYPSRVQTHLRFLKYFQQQLYSHHYQTE